MRSCGSSPPPAPGRGPSWTWGAAAARRARRGPGRSPARRRSSALIRTPGRLARRRGRMRGSVCAPVPVQADLHDLRWPEGPVAIVAAFTLNELRDQETRDRVLRRLLERAEHGDRVLVVEPLAGRIARWWNDWKARFVAAGGRGDDWRVPIELPPIVASLDRASGLHHDRGLTGRSLWLPGAAVISSGRASRIPASVQQRKDEPTSASMIVLQAACSSPQSRDAWRTVRQSPGISRNSARMRRRTTSTSMAAPSTCKLRAIIGHRLRETSGIGVRREESKIRAERQTSTEAAVAIGRKPLELAVFSGFLAPVLGRSRASGRRRTYVWE